MSEDESFDSFYGKLNEVVIGKFNYGEKTKDSKVVRIIRDVTFLVVENRERTRATGYQPTIYHRYGSPSHSHRNTDDEGMDGLHDERPQRMGV